MFAGAAARDEDIDNLNSIGNVMNMLLQITTAFLRGIEAKEEGRHVRLH